MVGLCVHCTYNNISTRVLYMDSIDSECTHIHYVALFNAEFKLFLVVSFSTCFLLQASYILCGLSKTMAERVIVLAKS